MTKDVTNVIQAKSDQMNADDLIGGPMTIKITDVNVKTSSDQPIEISFEGSKKYFRPCKTAARCLASIWGVDAKQWLGLSCTIYNDPTVTWGGAAIGGIRISHMEGLDKPRTLQLTKTRGKKGAVTIQPLNVAPQKDQTETIEEARTEAKLGRDNFMKWWGNNTDKHDVAKTIMDELKGLMADADNANDDVAAM